MHHTVRALFVRLQVRHDGERSVVIRLRIADEHLACGHASGIQELQSLVEAPAHAIEGTREGGDLRAAAFGKFQHALFADADALDPSWVKGAESVGITAGASAPEELVEELIGRLREMTETVIEILPGITENVRFRMPSQLTDNAARG